MIVCKAQQGTDEWLQDRCGVPTASMFSNILTATGKASSSAKNYQYQLLADWLAGQPVDPFPANFWMIRGTELEPVARETYEFITDNSVSEIGFVLRDDRMVGCSPDGLVDDNGLIEIKCPKASTHVSYILGKKLPDTYKQQVHGQLWIMEREWCDFFSYHPDMPVFKIRVQRDEKYIKTLADEMDIFIDKLLCLRKKLRSL